MRDEEKVIGKPFLATRRVEKRVKRMSGYVTYFSKRNLSLNKPDEDDVWWRKGLWQRRFARMLGRERWDRVPA